MKNITRTQYQAFPYHLVEPSPWPILTSFAMLTLTVSAVLYFHGFVNGGELLTLGFILVSGGMVLWFRDVITEGTKKIKTIMATTTILPLAYILLLLLITVLYLTYFILLDLENLLTNLFQYDPSTPANALA
jgi:cytochrome c oxidase subunit 3